MHYRLWKSGALSGFIGLFLLCLWAGARADSLPDIISVSEDHRIKQWDAKGKSVATIGSHDDAINAAALASAPDGLQIVTGDSAGTLKIWDVANAHLLLSEEAAHRGSIFSVAVSPDGKIIATGGADRHIRLWRRDTGRRLADVEAHQDSVRALRFFMVGNEMRLLSGGADNIVRVWRVQASGNKGELNYDSNIPAHDDAVTALALSPDGKTFASVSKDKWLKTWRTDGGGQENRSHADRALYAVTFSPDGKILAVGDEDGHIRLYDAQKGSGLPIVMTQERSVRALVFSADGKTLVSGGEDRKIHYWDVSTGKERQSIAAHDGVITALLLVP